MKAICLVAHPDDCIIFAYAFIHNHPEYQWDIAFVTNDQHSDRGQEIKQFWKSRGIRTLFLEFEDNPADHWETHSISFDTSDAKIKIQSLIDGYDLVLTHGESGEYGHIHHKFVNSCLREFRNVVTFIHQRGIYKFAILNYKLPQKIYSLSEVPLHASVISKFHKPNIIGNIYCKYTSPKDIILLFKLLISKFF